MGKYQQLTLTPTLT